MKYTPHTISYFLTWGAIYGVIFGLWSTTIMLPLMGSMFGLLWGAGIGVACGLLCGFIASLVQALTFHPDVNLPVYRSRLSIAMGLLVGIIAPLLLIATSEGILWGEHPDAPAYYIPSLLAVIFWGSLSAAYTGHGYPLWLSHIMMGKPYFSTPRLSIEDTVSALSRSGILWITLGLGGLIGIVWTASDILSSSAVRYSGPEVIVQALVGGAVGIVPAFVVLLLVLCGAAALIVFLKRLLFANDTLSTTSHTERITLTTAAALLTGAICSWPFILIPSLSMARLNWFFPVICALMIGFYAYRALPTNLDKAKRKEKKVLALEDSADEDKGLLVERLEETEIRKL